MTKTELSQLYWLNREIDKQKLKLSEIRSTAEKSTSYITDMPRGGSSIKDDIYAEIADLSSLIDLNIKKCIIECRRLERYLDSITDSETRMIFRLRYINGLPWERVCIEMGQEGDGSTQRKKHDRFLNHLK